MTRQLVVTKLARQSLPRFGSPDGAGAATDAFSPKIDVTIRPGALELVTSDVHVDNGELSTSGHEHAHEADVVPSSLCIKRGLEPGSDPATAAAGTLMR